MPSRDVDRRMARIAADRHSGAAELTAEVRAILLDGLREHANVEALSRAAIAAQPSMASVWNAARAALQCARDPRALEGFGRQVEREIRGLRRFAAGLFPDKAQGDVLRIVTISFSGTVVEVLTVLAASHALEVATAEGAPALEGRRMAERLVAMGAIVTHYADPALGLALAEADAVLLGADAVTPDWCLNKTGSRMLASAAGLQGVPVYVAATRSKFVSTAVGARLRVRNGSPEEVWPGPPPGVTVRNPYFEQVPLDLVTAVVSDAGVLGAAMLADACPTAFDALLLDLTV